MHLSANEQVNVTPNKLVCVGRNYVEHIVELGNDVPDEMVVFLKPNSAITDTLHSQLGEVLHYEAELCFMVQNGRFAAVGVGLDLTKRGLQSQLKSKGLPWERAKAFNGAALFSDFMAITPDQQRDFYFELTIDNQLIQFGYEQLMIYKADVIFNTINEFMHLVDGDIVMTGTPKGVGEVKKGSEFSLSLWTNITTDEITSPFDGFTELNHKPLVMQSWTAT